MSSNIKVAIRIRDKISRETSRPSVIKRKTSNEITLQKDNTANVITTVEHTFYFDQVFDESSNQKQIYHELAREYILKALEGYHTCVIAYGQTGAGKTYTMMGTEQEPGIIPLVSHELFKIIDMCQDEGPDEDALVHFKVTVSYFQIYNEQIYDMLSGGCNVLRVRDGPRKVTYIEGLSDRIVNSCEELLKCIEEGSARRSVAGTAVNENSSRSHAICTINIQQTEIDSFGDTVERVSSIKLVDLAGSERTKVSKTKDERFKEGTNINKSLMTLRRVVTMLSNNKVTGVPYRESLLTRVLRDNLDGNSITCILACISPCDYEESISTLRYASTAKHVRTEAHLNTTQISKGEEQLFSLQNQLKELQATLTLQTAELEDQRVLQQQLDKINETNKYLQHRLETENKICADFRNRWTQISWESHQLGSALLDIVHATEIASQPFSFDSQITSFQRDCAQFQSSLQKDKETIQYLLEKYTLV
ncbi:kinesin family protein Ecym_4066 [Eremothecium cymbalariae DBVPG|uniref:Kinesin-like protein n=1 Tax=Eremothecium cymbalariae (strain CBS 270.75 / DBVPG 7215 / KCTC 17166 / NRRL Y-17582) TaxID=931890 RepID=G8JSZ3_ERECY|nr:hypothetical protein Ecym_4066 [Eremothecium cymbalariae DBVPG\